MNKPTSMESVVAARKAMQPNATNTIVMPRSSVRRWARDRIRDLTSLFDGQVSRCHIVILPARIIRSADGDALLHIGLRCRDWGAVRRAAKSLPASAVDGLGHMRSGWLTADAHR